MNYRSITDLNNTITNNLHKIPKDVGLIVGIPRSGMLAANILALKLNLPLVDLEGFLHGRVFKTGLSRVLNNSSSACDKQAVIIIDESVYAGKEMARTREAVENANISNRMIYVAVYVAPDAPRVVDIHFETVQMPRVFEWNVFHHPILNSSCVDIDGVLCVDPTNEENDDGSKYMRFLEETPSVRIPTYEIGWLVTCRLEKYRSATEKWLEKHRILYKNLIMMDYPDKATRIAAGSHGKFKAGVFQQTNAHLFIESSAKQASEIHSLTQKPVLCVETNQIQTAMPSSGIIHQAKAISSTWKRLFTKVIR